MLLNILLKQAPAVLFDYIIDVPLFSWKSSENVGQVQAMVASVIIVFLIDLVKRMQN